MKVEIWSDIACPWCYVGKRQLEAAVARFGHADELEVVWRSFELDPSAPPRVGKSMDQVLARKYGMSPDQVEATNRRLTELAASLGLDYQLDRIQLGNTFDAHRVVHLAASHGRGDAMKERLLAAYFTGGELVSDRPTLARLAAEVGFDANDVTAMLETDSFAGDVRDDEARAGALGITGVPFFVIDGAYGISGAQSVDLLLGALERAWSESRPPTAVDPHPEGTAAGACEDGACAL